MSKKKYQIFISSTYNDLVQPRGKVIETILSLKHIPIGMENFTASNRTQWQYIQDVLKDCDYYVLIIGHRYGSIDSNTGKSYTEMEFDYAKQLNIPILSFVIDRNSMPLLPNDRESHDHEEKLHNFINQKVRSGTLNSKDWTNPDHLANLVTASLVSEMGENPRTGWIRADKLDELNLEIERLQVINQRLASQTIKTNLVTREPNIEVVLNDSESPYFELERVHYDIEHFEKLNYDELEGYHQYITSEEIDKYNKLLPIPEDVQEYNEALEKYTRIQYKRVDLSIDIINSGNQKAESIYIDLRFPKEVLIIEKGSEDEWEKPTRPDYFPPNPIKRAQKEIEKRHVDAMGIGKLDKLFPSNIGMPMPKLMGAARIRKLTSSNSNTYLWVEENKITIKINSLIHSRKVGFKEDVELVALKEGEFDIVGNIICEQFPEPREIIIPIRVTKIPGKY
ncbi:hypothetical protein A8L34_19435 [Bacillus sp. FJAT-27264]|uniref:DUF4062 domain-containing protein n=1 Tax=Paenibacillus sp. (strain DSM 101736 / FJAT-27264) TaxID=1850362 RepID=UPI000807DE6D|nr:DUF4062 domain-containing protein [Bacillus sp. FJAT-27264]OBZ10743.1 hypothetical protein A8L34_19435 [Bacillus sp. FJAT-27264]